MSKLLLDEFLLPILPRLAVSIGLNEAVILQQVHYWLVVYEQSKSLSHYKDGRWWVYNSVRHWQTNFPFWSLATIARTLQSLRQPFPPKGKKLKKDDSRLERRPLLLTTDKYNKLAYDKTLWYTICYDEVRRIEEIMSDYTYLCHFAIMDSSNLSEPIP